jgi:hypothetical protein
MTAMSKGLLLGTVQVALVLSLGGKLLYDRATRPRVWVLCEVYDPQLPLRGRYLSERLRLPAAGFSYKENHEQRNPLDWYTDRAWAHLEVRNGQLIATPQGFGPGAWVHLSKSSDGTVVALSEEPVLLFVPENARAPSLQRGQEMWIEVTVPANGPPRPIQIGIKRNGVITPLRFE